MSQQQTLGNENLSIILRTANNDYRISCRSIQYLYLIEDIFSFSIVGKLRFTDTVGISEMGPLSGGEKVFISYGGMGSYRTIGMDIHKIDKVEPKKLNKPEESFLIELTLVDEYFKYFNYNKWSCAWINESIGNIVKDICKKFLNITSGDFSNFESTKGKLSHFDTHLRSPAECIQWLMNRAVGFDTKCPGYLMYRSSNKNGGFTFNFHTLEQLLSNTKLMGPKDPNSNIEPVYEFEQSNKNYINKIKSFELSKVDLNALKSITGGVVSGYDIQNKRIIQKTYDYRDAIKKFTILGKKTLFPKDLSVIGSRVNIDGYSSEEVLDALWYGNWIKEYCHQQTAEIIVAGHVDRYAGGMIKLIWPSIDKKTQVTNNQMAGKYLVKSITHYFSPSVENGWVQKMVVIKNGYNKSPDNNLLDAVKENL